MATGIRKPGEFCWVNILTPEPAAACDFFGKLLGWTFQDMNGIGHGVHVDGAEIGGIFDLNSPNTPPGTPPHMGVMVKVENADATAERVNALGGKAMPAFDVMEEGRMAVCFDPNGANFDVWQPKKGAGMTASSMAPGAPTWFESLTTDAEKAAKFYADLFGWKPESMPMGDFSYTTFKLGDEFVGGMMPIQPHMGQIPPHWAIYFAVTDTDATAKLAADLGGMVCVPPMDIPNVGRFAGITSPQGVMFYVLKYATPG